MKFLWVLFAVLAVSYARKIDVNELVNKIQTYSKKLEKQDGGETSSEEIEGIIKDGLKEATSQIELALCKRNGTKLYDAAIKTFECAKDSKHDGVVCDTLNAEFKKCIVPIEKVLEECLEAKFHDVPKLIIDSITSTTEYLCDSKVRDIVELTNPCAAVDPDKLKKCVTGLESKLKDIDSVTNVKSEVCGELTNQKNCILAGVNENCKNDLTKKSFADLYEAAIVKPCKA